MITFPATYTAFQGNRRLSSGSLAEVALALRTASAGEAILIFDDATGRETDIDTRGTAEEVVSRLAHPVVRTEPEAAPRGRGRPRLGVLAREVTLLPRHWDWLGTQPGGASVTLRKLVDEARRTSGERDRIRAAQEAAYRFMSAIAGNLPGFEEVSRSLFARDRHRFAELIAAWPDDIRDHATRLAFADRPPDIPVES